MQLTEINNKPRAIEFCTAELLWADSHTSDSSRVVYNWLQYFSEDTLPKELEDADFNIQSIFDDVAGSDDSGNDTEITVVATKQ